jgi:hypothetical protein
MSCVGCGPNLPLKSFAGVDDIVLVSKWYSVVVCPAGGFTGTLAFGWSFVSHTLTRSVDQRHGNITQANKEYYNDLQAVKIIHVWYFTSLLIL